MNNSYNYLLSIYFILINTHLKLYNYVFNPIKQVKSFNSNKLYYNFFSKHLDQ